MRCIAQAFWITLLWGLVIAGVLALLGGCATTKEIKIPVPVTCKTPAPKEPDYPVVNPDDGLFVRVQKLLERDVLHEAYEGQLRAWGAGCNA